MSGSWLVYIVLCMGAHFWRDSVVFTFCAYRFCDHERNGGGKADWLHA